MSNTNLSLSERLRPTEPSHLLASDRVRHQLEAMLARKRPMNLSFWGPPGQGKTSAALMIANLLEADLIEVHGGLLRNAATVEEKITGPASSYSLWGNIRFFFIDEAGAMSKSADKALRIAIEKAHETCRFILCANERSEISSPLLSRCPDLPLVPIASERDAVLKRWIPEYKQRLRDLGVEFDDGRVTQIIYTRYPDLRAVANQIELEFELMKALPF